ncbi:hypothetical protein A3J77_00635 [Candidatus Wolfebacteria bacterium RBG_13_41_7]|uniref:Cell shape determination protein CcmA n=1 Tax=Candidatus Wolfebacteria bacterium RBG_13_41_7 TaxID=1802554 RepID=A0A1F8DKL2_9BACT|nr:MAG: hypothetical protein A3J77_00635 [Candidatus Wolfebacteria bacterium RBG_13_41_7]
MFKKEAREVTAKEAETIIGPSVKVKGNFQGEGNIIIEGTVEGNVKTSQNLLVGNKAKITANVEAGEAKIGGEIMGNIKVKGYLELAATAKILGDIEAAQVSIERGAIFNGKCSMPGGSSVAVESKN